MDIKHGSFGHEEDTSDIRGIVLTGVSLAVGVAIVMGMVYGIFVALAHHPVVIHPVNPMAETNQQQFPPEPRITDHPLGEIEEVNAQEDKTLSTYGWVNKSTGVVRIPIDQAMELQLQRGFPVRQGSPAKPGAAKK